MTWQERYSAGCEREAGRLLEESRRSGAFAVLHVGWRSPSVARHYAQRAAHCYMKARQRWIYE